MCDIQTKKSVIKACGRNFHIHLCTVYTYMYMYMYMKITSWEPEGRYHYSTMFHWEPEGRYGCTKSMAIVPFWLSMEHYWIGITPFWCSADEVLLYSKHIHIQDESPQHIYTPHMCNIYADLSDTACRPTCCLFPVIGHLLRRQLLLRISNNKELEWGWWLGF